VSTITGISRVAGSVRLEHLESVQIRHREVKEDEVGCAGDDGAQTEHRVLGGQHLVPRARQVHSQQAQERKVVFDDYDLGQLPFSHAGRTSVSR